ncbi:MAG: hypothetical protein IM574_06175 [Cytophagales bacterium]|nr:hypothetical protein [Cytophagales bacterium]
MHDGLSKVIEIDKPGEVLMTNHRNRLTNPSIRRVNLFVPRFQELVIDCTENIILRSGS